MVSEMPPESSSIPGVGEAERDRTMSLCYVTSLYIEKKKNTLHDMVNKGHCKNARQHRKQNYRMKTVTNHRGKSQGSTQTVLNPVRMIFFSISFHYRLKYLITKIKYLKQRLLNLQKSEWSISMKLRAVYLCNTQDITAMGNAEILSIYNLKIETSSRKKKAWY